MSPAPASRTRRSATIAIAASSAHSGAQPPPPPPGHPNQSVQAFAYNSQQQIHLPNQLPIHQHQDLMSATDDPHHHQQLQHSYSASNLYSQPPPQQQQQPQQQQENWSEYNWRSIFDAALVKAQQAVQLDELGETAMATQLYSQAANDLGRVIPLCGSEKKKQSMLTIQAIYLDRVQQLKTAAKAKKASVSTPQASEEEVRYSERAMSYQQESHHQQQPQYGQQQQSQQYQYQAQDQYQPPNNYHPPQDQYLSSQDPFQQQQQQQQSYQPPPPPTPPIAPQTGEKEGGFRLFGKKKSKAQTDDYAQQQQKEQQQQPVQDNNYNYETYNDYNNAAGGYISPPYSEPQKAAGSSAALVTPVFMTQTQTPSPTPPITSNSAATVETPEQSTKSSRWKPFGKKKSKSFSAGEASSSPYRPSNDYEIPTPPMPLGAQQLQHLVDPGDHADASYSQQQHADWYVGNDDGPVLDDYEQHTRYYDDDEDEDVDPYYIADNRGRAQAYEGKDSGKQPKLNNAPSKDNSLKESRKKPTLNHKASSYSSEQSFTPTFGPSGNGGAYSEEPAVYYQGNEAITDEQMFTAAYDDGYEYEDDQNHHQYQHQQQQNQYSQHGATFDPTTLMQHQHSQYSHDPSVQEPPPAETEMGAEGKSGKNKWFGKKNKKKEKDHTAEKEKYDDVAKRMDEALFGGGGSSSRKKDKSKDKSKDKNKDKKSEPVLESATLSPSPSGPHASDVRMSALPPPRNTSLDYDIRQFSFERNANLDVGFMADGQQQQYYDADEPQHQYQQHQSHQSHHQQQQQQYSVATATSSTPLAVNMDEMYTQVPSLTQAPSATTALTPIAYAPRTVYEPKTVYVPSKKPAPQPEELISEPAQLPSSLDLGANFQPQQQQHLQHQHQQQSYGTAGSVHSQEDGSLLSPDSAKKPKRPFNLFKSKKSNSKLSLEDGSPLSPTFGPSNDDSKSTHSDKTRKSSILSNDRKAVDAASAAALPKGKKRESEEYVPYEYQEDVEGPLMERVAVREDRGIIGFVLPVEEIIDYTAEGTDETAALENWDSWVNQLESFEKVLVDKGLKKENGKKSKKSKKAAKEGAAAIATAAAAAATATASSAPSSIFSSGMSEHRPMSVSDESVRTSMYSTRSSAIFGAELMSVQQAKRRWWSPKRKEATSVYSVSDSLSVVEQDQEKYLSSLLQNDQDSLSPLSPSSSTSAFTVPTSDAKSLQSQPDQYHRVTTADVLAVMVAAEERENCERQEALNALLESDGTNRGASLSLPLPQMGSMTSSTVSTQEIASVESSEIVVANVVPVAARKDENVTAAAETAAEEDKIVAPMPPRAAKVPKTKSTKSKLLPISTPLAQILKIQNPEELWLYVQQAKAYATTRMNKGDKRSAAIALKRAQALEARWQEIMLELASSEEDEDELLEDDDDDDDVSEEEDESEEEQQEVKVAAAQKTKAKTISVTPLVVNMSNKKAASEVKEVVRDEEDSQQFKSPVTPASARPMAIHPVEEEEGEDEDADEERRRMHLRKVTSRSDSAPDMFSKYKVSNKAAHGGSGSSKKNTLAVSIEETASAAEDTDGDSDDESETESVKKGKGKGGVSKSSSNRDSRLGGDATMEQMFETTNKEHLKFYIQRLKTDTVAKARSGSKFAALEGMKNVKVLQLRLADLEEGEGKEEGMGEGAEKEDGAEKGDAEKEGAEREGGAEVGEQAETVAA